MEFLKAKYVFEETHRMIAKSLWDEVYNLYYDYKMSQIGNGTEEEIEKFNKELDGSKPGDLLMYDFDTITCYKHEDKPKGSNSWAFCTDEMDEGLKFTYYKTPKYYKIVQLQYHKNNADMRAIEFLASIHHDFTADDLYKQLGQKELFCHYGDLNLINVLERFCKQINDEISYEYLWERDWFSNFKVIDNVLTYYDHVAEQTKQIGNIDDLTTRDKLLDALEKHGIIDEDIKEDLRECY